MKRKITLTLEAEIDLDLEQFEDCSEESELTDSIKDELSDQTFNVDIADDTYDFDVKSVEVKELPS